MKSVYDMMTKRRVVEPNKMTGLRIGHILAQQVLTELEWYGDIVDNELTIDNGFILYQDVDGYIKKPANANAAVQKAGHLYLHFTAEKQGGYSNFLAHYTTPFTNELDGDNGYLVYPRMIALYSGDMFTTDNFTGTLSGDTNYAKLATTGVLEVSDALPTSYNGPLFRATETTLPDGVTAAAQFELVVNYVELGA